MFSKENMRRILMLGALLLLTLVVSLPAYAQPQSVESMKGIVFHAVEEEEPEPEPDPIPDPQPQPGPGAQPKPKPNLPQTGAINSYTLPIIGGIMMGGTILGYAYFTLKSKE